MALAVSRVGSVAGAARELGVDATTVTRRLRALGDQLGLRLFERHAQGLRPTEAGLEVVAAAERMEAESLRLERSASGADKRLQGLVRVTTIESLASQYVSARLAPLVAQHPGLIIDLNTSDQMLDLTRSQADMALRMTPRQQEGIVVRKLGILGMALYASREYVEKHGRPRSLSELREHRCMGFVPEYESTLESRFFKDHLGEVPLVYRSNSTVALLAACKVGVGIALLGCYLANPHPELVQLFGPEQCVRREVSLVMHQEVRHVRRIRAVADHFVQMFREDAALLAG